MYTLLYFTHHHHHVRLILSIISSDLCSLTCKIINAFYRFIEKWMQFQRPVYFPPTTKTHIRYI